MGLIRNREKKTKQVTICIDNDIYELLIKYVESERLPFSRVVNRILKAFFDNKNPSE